MSITYEEFKAVSLADPFFDSLKEDYSEFESWFARKADNKAYIHRTDAGAIDGFLYLKREDGPVDDVVPPLAPKNRLKVGTFKIHAHGTRLGERFVKKIFDHALAEHSEELYVTVFAKHNALIALLSRYGFDEIGQKNTANGTELVLLRPIKWQGGHTDRSYPVIKLGSGRQFLLALKPVWHTRLLPDSMLTNEDVSIVQDISHANSIHKVYLTAMRGTENLVKGDVLLIYRTTDSLGKAHYRSVVTSACVVEEVRNINAFPDVEAFVKYCRPFSVFTEDELRRYFKTKTYPTVIRFTYNFALPKRPTRQVLVEDLGIDGDQYFGFVLLTAQQFRGILEKAEYDESLVID